MTPKEIMEQFEAMIKATDANVALVGTHFDDETLFQRGRCRVCESSNITRSKATETFFAHYCDAHYPNPPVETKRKKTFDEIFGAKL